MGSALGARRELSNVASSVSLRPSILEIAASGRIRPLPPGIVIGQGYETTQAVPGQLLQCV